VINIIRLLVALIICLTPCRLFAQPCARIISLAPSVTESLFSLGLGSQVVAVTRFDHYPSSVESLPKIGGFLDPSLEQVVQLHPSLVIGLSEQSDTLTSISKLGPEVLKLDHRTISSILESFLVIGKRCERIDQAARIVADLNREIRDIKSAVSGKKVVRAMIVVGDSDEAAIKNLFISGNDGYFNELLKIAGAENVYQGQTMGMPGVSREGIIRLNPEVVFEIASDPVEKQVDEKKILASWQELSMVSAVSSNRVYILRDNYFSIPGPRFTLVLKKFAALLHPEVFTSNGSSSASNR
jgi:iron complex transport system substrate-binding protein